MTWTVPNILTVLRLLAAPGIALAFLFLARPWADWAAIILFVTAALTDFVDGYLARRWNQMTKLGAMLDPIADKAMVVIALAVLMALYQLQWLLVIPATLILFREVFVSGLREFLGDTAGTLKVTRIAKWKTTTQLVAISVLLAQGLFVHYFGMWSLGMGPEITGQVLAGTTPDELGLRYVYWGALATNYGGIGLLWIAAVLTAISGLSLIHI